MALPSTITGSWPSWGVSDVGPFEIGGNLYVFTYDNSATIKVRAYKSTDGGNTWTEQDSAHAPVASNVQALQVVQVGSTLHVAYPSIGVKVVTFSSDTWGTPISTASTVGANTNASGTVAFCLLVRSNGNYVIAGQSATASVMGAARRRWGWQEWNGSAWSTAVIVGTGIADHYDFRWATLGASDRAHFFSTRTASSGTIFHQSIDSSNTADTESTVTTGASPATDAYGVYRGVSFTNGSNVEVAVPFTDSSTKVSIARFNSAANPTFTISSGVAGIGTILDGSAALAVDGTTKYLFWTELTSLDTYYDTDGGSNTWGTDTAFQTGTSNNFNSPHKITNAIGVAYLDGATTKYQKLALSVTPTISAGKVAAGTAVRGATLAASGHATVSPGAVAPGVVRGATVAASGHATLNPGAVASGSVVRGATVTGGAAPLAVGKVAAASVVRGPSLSPAGHATLTAGAAGSASTVRGATLAASGSVSLAAGRVAAATVTRGATLSAGAASITAGAVASTAIVRGAALAPSGHATVTAGRVGAATVVRGATVTSVGTGVIHPGAVASTVIVRGATPSPAGHATLAAGKVAAVTTVRGATIVPSSGAIHPGRAVTTPTVRGATLAPAGHATIVAGRAGATVTRGATLAGTGTATLAVGRVTLAPTAGAVALTGTGVTPLPVGRISAGGSVNGVVLINRDTFLVTYAETATASATADHAATASVTLTDTATASVELADTPT